MKSLLTVVLAAALPVPAHATGLDWEPCGTAQCATLTVPVDWADPGGETLGIRVARRVAADPAHKVGTLLFGPGGPWDSGVKRVQDDNQYHRFSDTLLSRFDIVSFDPRGSNASRPVSCDPAVVAEAPNPVLASQADFDATLAHNRELWAGCAALTGELWNHLDMLSNVRDLEALRAALGEDKLTFHGTSYGTLLGEQYAERYPGRVRAMVLESVDDHSVPTTGAFLTTQAAAYEDAFDDFADWCAADESCALNKQDVRAVWNRLRTADRGDYTAFDLVAWTLKELKEVKYAELADYLVALDGGGPAIRPPAGLGVVTPAFCSDWALPVRDFADYQRLLRQAEAVAPDTHYPAQVFALTMCLGWGPVANPQHVLRVRTDIPLLLLNSRHDAATGWNWAHSVERQLDSRGVLVTYEGAGHGAYTLSECTQRTVDDYLVTLTAPARGTVCAAA
jgi:pimeloyl-ACP methyl ester carboxylesterase